MLTRFYCVVFARALVLSESLRRLILRGLCAYAALLSPLSLADDDLAGMADSVSQGATSGTKSVLNIAQFIGVLGVIGSIIALKSMKNNPQVKPWHIGLAFVAGLILIVIPQIIKKGQTQMGMTAVSVG